MGSDLIDPWLYRYLNNPKAQARDRAAAERRRKRLTKSPSPLKRTVDTFCPAVITADSQPAKTKEIQMSWSIGTKSVAKSDADAAIDALTTLTNDPQHEDQLRTAKQAAKQILMNIPGPFVVVTLSGHANGMGWNQKAGWANDCISINVTQMFEATPA